MNANPDDVTTPNEPPFEPSGPPSGQPHDHPAGDAYDQPDESERTWALFMHLSHLVISFIGIPVITPLILWLIKKDESAYLDDQGKEAVNFEISLILWYLISIPAGFILGTFTCGIGFILWGFPWVLGLIGVIVGSIAATKGNFYRYPMCFRLIK